MGPRADYVVTPEPPCIRQHDTERSVPMTYLNCKETVAQRGLDLELSDNKGQMTLSF